jgi:plasmid maintenance system antidote protein VapI
MDLYHRRRRRNHLMAAAMARLGLTSRDVARAAGIREDAFSRVFCLHRTPTPEETDRIALALGTQPQELGLPSTTNREG